MNDELKPKDGTKTTGLFSISFSDTTSGLPGVTQLLNPKLIAEKEAAKKAKQVKAPELEAGQAFTDTTEKSLIELGIQFELQFNEEQGSFRYSKMNPHLKTRLELWQEKFYFQMKLDPSVFNLRDPFSEFSIHENPFIGDALGITDANYVQFVRLNQNRDRIFILCSPKSLLHKRETIERILSGGNPRSSPPTPQSNDEFKIELVS